MVKTLEEQLQQMAAGQSTTLPTLPNNRAVSSAGQNLPTKSGSDLAEYRQSLIALTEEGEARRSLNFENTLDRPALALYCPDDEAATKVKLDFLTAEISQNLCGFFNVKYGMDADQVGLTAAMILESYGHEISASGFVVFSKTFIANRLQVGGMVHSYYDDLYSRLDGEVIAAGLRKFLGLQQRHREGQMRVDESFIDGLPARIRIMSDAEIVALSKIGGRAQQAVIRSIISNWLNSGQHPGIPALASYIHPPRI